MKNKKGHRISTVLSTGRGVSLLSVLFILPLLFVEGCAPKPDNTRDEAVSSLFESSVTLIKDYTDSIRNCTDSVRCQTLGTDFEEAISKLNFSFPAETDKGFTEAENDTLSALLDRYVAARDSRLKEIHLASVAVKTEAESDSIGG